MRVAAKCLVLLVLPPVYAAPVVAHPGLHHDIKRLTQALAQAPQRPSLWIERAYYYRLDGQHTKALGDLDRARALAPDNAEVWLHRGLTLAAMGRDTEAEEELSRFLEAGAGSAAAYAARGGIRERTGRAELALSDYSAALVLKEDVELYLIRGRLQESRGKLDEAAAGYRDALARLGAAVAVRLALIRVESKRGKYAAALALVDDALERAAVKTDWYLRRAKVLQASGRLERARADREKALVEADRVLKKRATALHLLSRAEAILALGRVEDARRDLRLALEKSPRFAPARELLEKLPAPHAP